MTIGFRVRRPDNSILYDSSSIPSAFIDIIDAEAGVGGTKNYPRQDGRILTVQTISSTLVFDYRNGNGSISAVRANAVVTYVAGIPIITWSYSRTLSTDVFVDTVILVFVK